MKYLIIGLASLFIHQINGQSMSPIQDRIHQLFIATDQGDWSSVEASFAAEVVLDYSSMTQVPAQVLKPNEISTQWKSILPGFEHTHHQVGNFISKKEEESAAHAFCYGIASHYLTHPEGNTWTVVGEYDFDLVKNEEGDWKVSKMTFHYKYQEGNVKLPAAAIENAK